MYTHHVAKLGGVSIGSEENGWSRPVLQLAHTGIGTHQLLLGCRGMLTYITSDRFVSSCDRNLRAMVQISRSWLDTGLCV